MTLHNAQIRGTCLECSCHDAVVDVPCPNCGQVNSDVDDPKTQVFEFFHVLRGVGGFPAAMPSDPR